MSPTPCTPGVSAPTPGASPEAPAPSRPSKPRAGDHRLAPLHPLSSSSPQGDVGDLGLPGAPGPKVPCPGLAPLGGVPLQGRRAGGSPCADEGAAGTWGPLGAEQSGGGGGKKRQKSIYDFRRASGGHRAHCTWAARLRDGCVGRALRAPTHTLLFFPLRRAARGTRGRRAPQERWG